MFDNYEKQMEYWLRNTVRIMNNVYDKKFNKYNLTGAQVSILAILWRKDGVTQKEFNEQLKLRAPSVSGLIDIICDKGLIMRRQDPEDARFKRIFLTEEGKKIKNKSMEVIKETQDEILKGFSEEEKVIFISWMKRLNQNLSKIEEKE